MRNIFQTSSRRVGKASVDLNKAYLFSVYHLLIPPRAISFHTIQVGTVNADIITVLYTIGTRYKGGTHSSMFRILFL